MEESLEKMKRRRPVYVECSKGAQIRDRGSPKTKIERVWFGGGPSEEWCLQPGAPSLGLIWPGCDRSSFSLSLSLSPELYYDRGNHHEFVSLVKDLARPGEITQSQAFDFEFTHVEKPYESYTGQNVKLR
jgi:hypothetical protein